MINQYYQSNFVCEYIKYVSAKTIWIPYHRADIDDADSSDNCITQNAEFRLLTSHYLVFTAWFALLLDKICKKNDEKKPR